MALHKTLFLLASIFSLGCSSCLYEYDNEDPLFFVVGTSKHVKFVVKKPREMSFVVPFATFGNGEIYNTEPPRLEIDQGPMKPRLVFPIPVNLDQSYPYQQPSQYPTGNPSQFPYNSINRQPEQTPQLTPDQAEKPSAFQDGRGSWTLPQPGQQIPLQPLPSFSPLPDQPSWMFSQPEEHGLQPFPSKNRPGPLPDQHFTTGDGFGSVEKVVYPKGMLKNNPDGWRSGSSSGSWGGNRYEGKPSDYSSVRPTDNYNFGNGMNIGNVGGFDNSLGPKSFSRPDKLYLDKSSFENIDNLSKNDGHDTSSYKLYESNTNNGRVKSQLQDANKAFSEMKSEKLQKGNKFSYMQGM